MNSHILSKFAIYAATFVINALMLVAVNYLFNGQMQERSGRVSVVHTDGAGKTADHGVALVPSDRCPEDHCEYPRSEQTSAT
jgi:hypothetical protein